MVLWFLIFFFIFSILPVNKLLIRQVASIKEEHLTESFHLRSFTKKITGKFKNAKNSNKKMLSKEIVLMSLLSAFPFTLIKRKRKNCEENFCLEEIFTFPLLLSLF
jgi:hypothetical protein